MSDYLSTVMRALRFWTRLPLPVLSFEIDPHGPPLMSRLAPAAPAIGAIVGLIGALVLIVATACGLRGWPAAILAVGATILVTGAMHEDGLADVADSFGGDDREAKLAIMKDSNLGSYGVIALLLVIMLKLSALTTLAGFEGVARGGCGLVAAAIAARVGGLWPLVTLPPARRDGAGLAAGPLPIEAWRGGAYCGAALAVVLAFLATGVWGALLGLVAAILVPLGVTWLAERHIGGQTGDVCGAATLLSETAFLLALIIPIGF